jgi:predicted DsbA family dithiol-disulfide isomerase
MENYFHQNRNITEPENLVRIANETSLDVPGFLEALRDPALGREVVDDHNEAVSMGINGVPTVIVDGRWRIAGAQEREIYRRVVELRLAGRSLS